MMRNEQAIYRSLFFTALTAITSWLFIGCSGGVKLDTVNIIDAAALQPQAIVIAPTSIAFSSYWVKDQRKRVSSNEIDTLKQRYQEALSGAVAKELEAQGWKIIDKNTANERALSVRLNVTNMRITAPDFNGAMNDLYSQPEHGSGDFALVFSSNVKPVATFADRRTINAGAGTKLSRTNRALNQRAFNLETREFVRDALSAWAAAQ